MRWLALALILGLVLLSTAKEGVNDEVQATSEAEQNNEDPTDVELDDQELDDELKDLENPGVAQWIVLKKRF